MRAGERKETCNHGWEEPPGYHCMVSVLVTKGELQVVLEFIEAKAATKL